MLHDDLYIFESPAFGMLKIGHSGDPQKRLASGSTFCPDPQGRLIAIVAKAGHHEQEVHRAFAAFHSHKEWFFDAPEIRAWISGGCDFASLPKQLNVADGTRHDISCRHNPRHIEGLVEQVEILAGRRK